MTRHPISAFAELESCLLGDLDPLELAALLVERAAALFGMSDAGLVSRPASGKLQLVSITSYALRPVELFQVGSGEGPCPESCATGAISAVPDLERAADRWPRFCSLAGKAGVRATYSFPIRARAGVLGCLDLLSTRPRRLNKDDLAAAQAYANVAGVSLGQAVAARGARAAEDQLRRALTSRIVIEQAKGLLAQRYRIETDDAFALLRRYARSRNRRLSEVATDLVHHGVDPEGMAP